MRIGELSSRAGVSTDALRLYERLGLIRSERRPNGYRDYDEAMLFVVNYVRMAQRLGFTLSEIGAEVPALIAGELTADRVSAILSDKLALIDARMAGLQALRTELAGLLASVCPVVPPVRFPRKASA
jgi:DNA-binding transcriptional MerR regulator